MSGFVTPEPWPEPGGEKARKRDPWNGQGAPARIVRPGITQTSLTAAQIKDLSDEAMARQDRYGPGTVIPGTVTPSVDEPAPTYEYENFQFNADTFWQEYMTKTRSELGLQIGDDGFVILPEPEERDVGLNDAELNDWNRYLESLTGSTGMLLRKTAGSLSAKEQRELLTEWKKGGMSSALGGDNDGDNDSDRTDIETPSEKRARMEKSSSIRRRYASLRAGAADRVKNDKDRISRGEKERKERDRIARETKSYERGGRRPRL